MEQRQKWAYQKLGKCGIVSFTHSFYDSKKPNFRTFGFTNQNSKIETMIQIAEKITTKILHIGSSTTDNDRHRQKWDVEQGHEV